MFEGSVLEAAADVERGRFKGALKVRGESGWGPDGAGGEESGEYGLGAGATARMGAVEVADGGGFFGGVAEPLARKGWFDFEHCINALGG